MSLKDASQFFLLFAILLLFLSTIKIIVSNIYGVCGLMFCIYFNLFYALPAVFHVNKNSFPFYSLSYDEGVIFSGALYSFIFIVFCLSGYFCNNYYGRVFNCSKFYVISARNLFWILVSFILIQIFFIFYFGVDIFLTKRGDFESDAFGAGTHERALMLNGIRGVSFICLLYSIVLFKSNKLVKFIISGLSFCLFSIINFPLSISRFQLFSYFLCFVLIYIGLNRTSKFLIFLVFFLGLTTIFPYVSYLSRGQGDFMYGPIEYYTTAGDFDGFQSFLNVIQMTDKVGYSLGYQVLGAILAFVPRAYWPEKPLPTGLVAAEYAGYDFSNISAPIVSEMYADFWIFGIIIGAYFIGWILRFFDNRISAVKAFGLRIELLPYAIIFSFLVIFFRGSLASVVSPFLIEIFIIYATLSFVKR